MKNNNKLFVKEGRLICYYPLEIKEKKNINRVREKMQMPQIVISEEKDWILSVRLESYNKLNIGVLHQICWWES